MIIELTNVFTADCSRVEQGLKRRAAPNVVGGTVQFVHKVNGNRSAAPSVSIQLNGSTLYRHESIVQQDLTGELHSLLGITTPPPVTKAQRLKQLGFELLTVLRS